MLSVSPWNVKQLQQRLPINAGVLEFYLYDRYLYSWLVTRNAVSYRKVEIAPDQFVNDIFDLRSARQTVVC